MPWLSTVTRTAAARPMNRCLTVVNRLASSSTSSRSIPAPSSSSLTTSPAASSPSTAATLTCASSPLVSRATLAAPPGRTSWKQRSRNVWSITAFFRVRRKSWRNPLSAIRTIVSRNESSSIACTSKARRSVSEVKSPLRPFRRPPWESFLKSSCAALRISGCSSRIRLSPCTLRGIRVPFWGDVRRCWPSATRPLVFDASLFSLGFFVNSDNTQRIRMRPSHAIPLSPPPAQYPFRKRNYLLQQQGLATACLRPPL